MYWKPDFGVPAKDFEAEYQRWLDSAVVSLNRADKASSPVRLTVMEARAVLYYVYENGLHF